MTEALTDNGYTCVRHSHDAVNTGMTTHISHDIKQHKYTAMWVEYPLKGQHVRPRRWFAYMSQLCVWANLCLGIGIQFILFGSTGKKWEDPQLQVMMSENKLHVSKHRLCHYGIKIDPFQSEPSGTCFATASTIPIKGHPCLCKIKFEDHKIDWNTPATSSQSNLKLKATVAMGRAILGDCRITQEKEKGPMRIAPDSNSNAVDTNPTFTTDSPGDQRKKLRDRCKDIEASAHKVIVDSDQAGLEPALLAESAFPTEGRERQKVKEKARKLLGLEPNRKKYVIEEHYDDCGSDLSGLGPDVLAFMADYLVELESSDSESEFDTESSNLISNLHVWWLKGSEAASMPGIGPQASTTRICSTFLELQSTLAAMEAGDDIVELCGGVSRITKVCVRRHLKSGGNYDLVTGCDLNTREGQRQFLDYLEVHRPLVVVMGPTCTPFGPWSNLNKVLHYDSWLKSYHNAAPHGRFCGRVALIQIRNGRFFVNEQPFPSNLYEEPPWSIVVKDPTVVHTVIHQCMTGQVGATGRPVKKPTGFVANHFLLLSFLFKFICDGSHEHDHLEGGIATRAAQVYTWKLAAAIADGICALKKHLLKAGKRIGTSMPAYPEMGSGPGDEPQADPEAWRKCPGCR